MICPMEKILVSACLLGDKCTYKGSDNKVDYLQELNEMFDLIPFCPEVEGGLPTPRLPSEIKGASVVREDGVDVSGYFSKGAFKATSVASYLGVSYAILKENSPSCGVHHIHDGSFKNRLKEGEGMTTAALRRMGVRVMNEEEGRAFLEETKRQRQIKDEKTRVNLAREEAKKAQEEAPKVEEKPERKPFKPYRDKPKSFDRKGPRKGNFGKKPHHFGKGAPKKRFPKKENSPR